MDSSFPNSFDQPSNDSHPPASTQSFDVLSQRFDSLSNFADSESVMDSALPIFTSQTIPDTPSPTPIYASGAVFMADSTEFSSFSPESNGNVFGGGYEASDGPNLPSLAEMEPELGFALREWRRQNGIRLEEKENREKELMSQIIAEAEEYKVDFYNRRKVSCENNRATNREKEKLFLASHEKFHVEADKNYWKAIAELVPNEVPTIEKKRGKKEQEKQPSIVVVQGPKPGKPTDLLRMRQILLKLKHNTPPHLKPSQPPAPTKDAKTGTGAAAGAAAAPSMAAAVATSVGAVAVA